MEEKHEINKNITIKHVATDAGVSVSAVSKVMRNAYGVSKKLRKNVQASIDKLGYRPRAAARGMRGRTFTVGVLVSSMRNPLTSDLVDGIREVCDGKKYRIMFGVGRAHNAMEKDLIESMIDHQMDGIILIAPRLSPKIIEGYAKQIPIVCIGFHVDELEAFDTVNVNDLEGAKIAVRHLVGEGCKKIHMFSLKDFDDFKFSVMHQRELGYKSAMKDAGLADNIMIEREFSTKEKQAATSLENIYSGTRPEAVFCWSDIDAIYLLDAIEKDGLHIPSDISVIGFDNSTTAALPQISLTSIDQDGQGMGGVAANVLFDRMSGRTEPRKEFIEPRLIERKTTKNL